MPIYGHFLKYFTLYVNDNSLLSILLLPKPNPGNRKGELKKVRRLGEPCFGIGPGMRAVMERGLQVQNMHFFIAPSHMNRYI